MPVMYEWDIETCSQEDANDDYWSSVEDHNESDSLSKYRAEVLAQIDMKQYQLVLVKAGLNADGYIESREHAKCYFGPGGVLALPATFDDGKKVPAKFHQELLKAAIKS